MKNDGEDSLTVLTYNVHSGVGADGAYDLARIADVIKIQAPQIVALQEIEVNEMEQKTRLWSVSHHDDQVRLITISTGLEFQSYMHFRWRTSHPKRALNTMHLEPLPDAR